MAGQPPRKTFVTLPVRDLKKSMEFVSSPGFRFEPRFTDEKAACLIVSDQACFMLLSEPFFRSFTKRELADASRYTEAWFALSRASRAEVDELAKKAVAAGGSQALDPHDHGFMSSRSFYDLDGHHREAFWMDPSSR